MIERKDNAICFANGRLWFFKNGIQGILFDACMMSNPLDEFMGFGDFQLNEIRIGDYIEKSELDTEQKYNDVVEVFELFGIFCDSETGYTGLISKYYSVVVYENGYCNDEINHNGKRKLTYNQIMAIGKLKRMMNEKPEVEEIEKAIRIDTSGAVGLADEHRKINEALSKPMVSTDNAKATANKYEREISDRQGNSATVDVYDVLKAFDVTCPATQHAVKKLLCSGIRGHKDLTTDLIEAKESIVRAIELNG